VGRWKISTVSEDIVFGTASKSSGDEGSDDGWIEDLAKEQKFMVLTSRT